MMPRSEAPKEILLKIIKQRAKRLQKKKNVWTAGSKFNAIRTLQMDNRGEVGEEFVATVLSVLGYETKYNNETNPTKKHWDILVGGKIKLEVKTASLGQDGKMFQHEEFEKDRNYDAVVLVDIAPNDLYLTVAPKDTLPFVQANDNWTINQKKMHRRRKGISYKWDLSLKDVESRKIETPEDVKRMFNDLLKGLKKSTRAKK